MAIGDYLLTEQELTTGASVQPYLTYLSLV